MKTTERDFDPVTGVWFPRIESRPSEHCRAAAAYKAMTGMEPVFDHDQMLGIQWMNEGRVKVAPKKGGGYVVLHVNRAGVS